MAASCISAWSNVTWRFDLMPLVWCVAPTMLYIGAARVAARGAAMVSKEVGRSCDGRLLPTSLFLDMGQQRSILKEVD
ncbi:hypothetical protein ET464_15155 [Paenibacillus protaetiae]|uniref:Uncharacterized protein n=1 Tax=Paenibacillus protaetiae TaxID=2509456 RepID=A0A4P6FAJ6_9BACL|nr:hypothetical protein ET464_15155 [Paenibacillus protaetiae]